MAAEGRGHRGGPGAAEFSFRNTRPSNCTAAACARRASEWRSRSSRRSSARSLGRRIPSGARTDYTSARRPVSLPSPAHPPCARGTHAALTAARTPAELPELDGDAAVRRAPGVRRPHCHSALPFAVPLGFSMQKRTRWREMTVRPSFVQRSRAGSARRRATGPTGHAPGPRRSRRGGSRVTSRGI
jgi:hypothetical protein